jgi:lipopolysaccharide transport system ATP-binding protein
MSNPIITVDKLSKCYLIGRRTAQRESYSTLSEAIAQGARNFGRNAAQLLKRREIVPGDEITEFWALKNVTFSVEKGNIIGIIGRNGAGKSTLLKILGRITEPTAGRIVLGGRVANLLEIGTGFHPELTGRENIFLNGAILGLRQREIRRKFDEIVAFAQVEAFIDTPVKRYSSGMHVRLGFAVAAHLEPDILIVDEVLAVGDAEFQKKCLGKMDEISRRQGRTVLLVSHQMGVVASLCRFAIWLDHGSIRQFGNAREVIDGYLTNQTVSRDRSVNLARLSQRRDDAEVRITLVLLEWLCDLPLRHGGEVRARLHFTTVGPIVDLAFTIGFSNLEGQRILSYDSDLASPRYSVVRAGRYSVVVEVRSLALAPGIYNLDMVCRSANAQLSDTLRAAAQLEVVAGPATPGYLFASAGGVRYPAKWIWPNETDDALDSDVGADIV